MYLNLTFIAFHVDDLSLIHIYCYWARFLTPQHTNFRLYKIMKLRRDILLDSLCLIPVSYTHLQKAPYLIADVVALLFIAHGNTSFGSLAPIIPYLSLIHI